MLSGLVTATASHAEPDVSDDDVRSARAAVTSAAGQVAALEAELAAHTAELDAAWTAVDAAGESYSQALVDRDAAAQAADLAAEREAAAAEEVEAARAELGTIALAAYRSGGSMDGLGAVLSADGFEDLVERTAAIARLGEQAERAVQRFDAADLVARTLGARAATARDEADAAAASAEDALTQAQELQRAAEATVTRVAAERERLIGRLAELRQTSVEVERARQQTLEAERAARAEAAAAASRGVTVTPPAGSTPPPPPPVGSSGGSGDSSAPGGTGSTPPPATPPVAPPPATSPPVTPPPVTPPPVVTPPPPAPSDPYGLGTGSQRGSADQGNAAVAWAVAQVGKPYLWGGNGPDAFDCSGLTSQAWRAAGLSINRTSRDQYRQVRKITYDSMRPGDLIFYGSVGSDPGSITHVAMYVGNGQMVEAPRKGVNLRVTPVRWSGTMPYAGRP